MWNDFVQKWKLTQEQLHKLQYFWQLLSAANDDFNLTTITQEKSFLAYHLDDSLSILDWYTPWLVRGCIDVGSGGGFPGIPLAIAKPETNFILLEVIHKKVVFLQSVVDALELPNVQVVDLDWRTFLRKTQYNDIDVICARASLAPEELVRMFKPSSHYKTAKLVYWASRHYEPSAAELPYFKKEYKYSVGSKKRVLREYDAGIIE